MRSRRLRLLGRRRIRRLEHIRSLSHRMAPLPSKCGVEGEVEERIYLVALEEHPPSVLLLRVEVLAVNGRLRVARVVARAVVM